VAPNAWVKGYEIRQVVMPDELQTDLRDRWAYIVPAHSRTMRPYRWTSSSRGIYLDLIGIVAGLKRKGSRVSWPATKNDPGGEFFDPYGGPWGTTLEGEHRIRQFLERYGPLGLLPAQARVIASSTNRQALVESGAEPGEEEGSWEPTYDAGVVQSQHVLTAHGWTTIDAENLGKDGVDSRRVLNAVIWQRIGEDGFTRSDLEDCRLRYFPEQTGRSGIRRVGALRPGTADFWRHYAEPLDEFLDVAVAFRDAVLDLHSYRGRRNRLEFAHDALVRLERFTRDVTVSTMIDGTGRITRYRVPRSLLSWCGFNAIDDIMHDRLHTCRGCGELYRARKGSGTCSPACRSLISKRANRGRS
jgi:hypothetical protein